MNTRDYELILLNKIESLENKIDLLMTDLEKLEGILITELTPGSSGLKTGELFTDPEIVTKYEVLHQEWKKLTVWITSEAECYGQKVRETNNVYYAGKFDALKEILENKWKEETSS
jgi:hypothetical protein